MTKKLIRIGFGDGLVIVDWQLDFMKGGLLDVVGVPGELSVMEIGGRLRFLANEAGFGMVFCSEDYHPAGGHVEYAIYGKHCVQGTPGQAYEPGMRDVYARARKFRKGGDANMFAYSVATAPEYPGHIADMRAGGIKRVYLGGLAFTHCVGESAIDFARQGFETFVIRDLTRSVPPPYGNPALMVKKLKAFGVKIINFCDLKLAA